MAPAWLRVTAKLSHWPIVLQERLSSPCWAYLWLPARFTLLPPLAFLLVSEHARHVPPQGLCIYCCLSLKCCFPSSHACLAFSLPSSLCSDVTLTITCSLAPSLLTPFLCCFFLKHLSTSKIPYGSPTILGCFLSVSPFTRMEASWGQGRRRWCAFLNPQDKRIWDS